MNISKLQKIQNFAARKITKTCKFDHITLVPQELRWLPVSYYLMVMVGVLVFKCEKGQARSYLSDRFVTRSIVYDHNTRNKDYLNFPAYQSAAGKLCNSLPRAITPADSLRT